MAETLGETETNNLAAPKTVFDDSAEYNLVHPLKTEWTLWFDKPIPKGSHISWEENLNEVATFGTVEEFWGLFNNIAKTSQLINGANYHLFRKGIKPAWEDKENKKGGKWVVSFSGKEKEVIDEVWMNSVLMCVGETLTHSEDISGLVFSMRLKGDKIALWTKTSESADICLSIGQEWREVIKVAPEKKIGYQSHADAISQNSSFNNRDRYTV